VDAGPGRRDYIIIDTRPLGGLVWDLRTGRISAPVRARVVGFEITSAVTTTSPATAATTGCPVGAGRDRTDGGAGTDHCINGEIRSGCERVT